MDYTMARGDTKVIAVTVTNTDGSPRDLTGATLFLTCKVSPADDAPFFQKTVSGVNDPAAGVAELTIEPTDTASITSYAVYVYDVELLEASGQTTTVQSGKLTITLDVTD